MRPNSKGCNVQNLSQCQISNNSLSKYLRVLVWRVKWTRYGLNKGKGLPTDKQLLNEYFNDFRVKDKCDKVECLRIWRKNTEIFHLSDIFLFWLFFGFPEILACWWLLTFVFKKKKNRDVISQITIKSLGYYCRLPLIYRLNQV